MEFNVFKSSERREQEIQSRILEVAGMAVAEALDRRTEGHTMPFQVEIPPPPGKMEPRDYLEKVQAGASLTLDLCDKAEIACDQYHTGLVNARIVTGRLSGNLFTRHYRKTAPRLVFRELRPAES
jgi:hypothetical protein